MMFVTFHRRFIDIDAIYHCPFFFSSLTSNIILVIYLVICNTAKCCFFQKFHVLFAKPEYNAMIFPKSALIFPVTATSQS